MALDVVDWNNDASTLCIHATYYLSTISLCDDSFAFIFCFW